MTPSSRMMIGAVFFFSATCVSGQTVGLPSPVGGIVNGVTGGVGGAIGSVGGGSLGGGSLGGGSLSGGGGGGIIGGATNTVGNLADQLVLSGTSPLGPLGTSTLGSSTLGSRSVITYRRRTLRDIENLVIPDLSALATDRWVQSLPPESLALIRQARLQELVRLNANRLEMDGAGNPANRYRLVAINPTPAMLARAKKAGFRQLADEQVVELGLRLVTMETPRSSKLGVAKVQLQKAVPSMTVEFDHIYEPAGGALSPVTTVALAASAMIGDGQTIGMIDGGVGAAPALDNASIEQKGFAGVAEPTGHGTAVASLMVGSHGKFTGAARGANLMVGDIYGGDPASGSARAIVNALGWLATKRPSVINISVVGPRNLMVERAVAAIQRKGIKVVAAVGNDGPAAPLLFPANQAGVIAVTGVDSTRRAIPEAGRSLKLDYAAPGADMSAALPGGGYTDVRGTSYAAPLVAARLATSGSTASLDREAGKGFGRIGRGIVCMNCAVVMTKIKNKKDSNIRMK